MDYYSTLGLSRNATKEEIKDAFRNSALKFHPDRHSQSTKEVRDQAILRFKQVSEAYEVLIDDRKRADFDRAPPRRPFTGRSGYSSGHHGYGYSGSSYYGGTPRSRSSSGGLGLDAEFVFRLMTRRGFLVNAAFACALLGGAVIIEQSGEAVWKMNNSGKSFEEAMESIEKIKVEKERD